MQRYFAKDRIDNEMILHDSDIHHIKNVMRAKIGDQIEIVYNNVVSIYKIVNTDPLAYELVENKDENNELPVELTIAIALVNEQKMDLILQKLTELGVTKIIPLKTDRSIVKLDEKKVEKKLSRWQMICKEASEQCKRTRVPQVDNIMTLKQLSTVDVPLKMLCSLNEQTKTIGEYTNKETKKILFAIGPEGGFTKDEEKLLIDADFMPTTLGKRVMRVETAAIYLASIIKYIYEG